MPLPITWRSRRPTLPPCRRGRDPKRAQESPVFRVATHGRLRPLSPPRCAVRIGTAMELGDHARLPRRQPGRRRDLRGAVEPGARPASQPGTRTPRVGRGPALRAFLRASDRKPSRSRIHLSGASIPQLRIGQHDVGPAHLYPSTIHPPSRRRSRRIERVARPPRYERAQLRPSVPAEARQHAVLNEIGGTRDGPDGRLPPLRQATRAGMNSATYRAVRRRQDHRNGELQNTSAMPVRREKAGKFASMCPAVHDQLLVRLHVWVVRADRHVNKTQRLGRTHRPLRASTAAWPTPSPTLSHAYAGIGCHCRRAPIRRDVVRT